MISGTPDKQKLRKTKMTRRAFSILEVLVTLLLVAMVVTGVLKILNYVNDQSEAIALGMSQLASIEYSLDKLIADVSSASQEGGQIKILRGSYDQHETSHLTIVIPSGDRAATPQLQIEWVAVPRYEQEDLVLFRREKKKDQSETAYYIPQCENLSSFQVEMQDANSVSADGPVLEAGLLEVRAQLFRPGSRDPGHVTPVSRSCCLSRFP